MSEEEVLARGRFRVDRRRALEKMEKFQLANPLAYTLELVAAAVAAGATRIEIENDSDDFVLRWDGDGPTRDELDALFDHLFGGAASPRAAMLQHLALGVLGALGQSPKWVHVDREGVGGPPLRLAVTNPAETRSVEHAHDGKGTRVHVRQRLSMANLAEALLSPFQHAAEARLVRERARWCPVPVLLDGVAIPRPTPKEPLGGWSGEGELWLVPDQRARIDLVRRGVVVGTVERGVGPLGVTGWLRADTVELDASRANVVEDGAWEALGRAIDEAVGRLVAGTAEHFRARLASPDPGPARAQARGAAVWLAAHRRPLGPYAELPLLVDLAGRAWSVSELAAFEGKKGTVADSALAEPGLPVVLFALTESATLDALAPGLPDLTSWLRTRAEGRERRRQAEAERKPPEFPPSIHQRRFRDGPLRGAVRFEGGAGTSLRVSYRIEGVQVQETHLPSPAGLMAAVLDHPGFTPDDAFKSVREDEVRAAAERRLLAEAAAFAADHVERIARGASLSPSAIAVLTAAVRAAGAKARTDLAALLASRPEDRLLRAPAFPCGDGRRLGLPELLDAEWIVVASLPPDCPSALAKQVLVVPDEHAPTWLGWLGRRARDGRQTLAEEIRGAQRRAGPKRPARLDGSGPRVPVEGTRTGELGLSGSTPEARIELLRDRIPVCTVCPTLGLPGVVGVIDDPALPVNVAHDAIASADWVPRLVRDLGPAVDALAKAAWDAAGEPPEAVLAWIAARGEALPDWAASRTLATDAGGATLTVASLRARATDRRAARIKLLSHPVGEVPGFEDAFVVSPALRRALEAVGGRAVRDADPDHASAARNLGAYLARPDADTPRALAERIEEKDGLRCRWLLPADPERAGILRVEARWRGRVLTHWERGESLGLLGVLEGPGIAPNAGLTMLRDPNILTPWYRHARSRFDDVLRDALDARGDGVPAEERAAWRAILARLEGVADRSKSETGLRDRLARRPLFERLDGTLVSREQIAAAREAGPVLTVPAGTARGPADLDWYVRDEPWTAPALGVLASRVPAGGPALAAWREGEARRRALAPREAKVGGDVLVRASVEAPGLAGEIGLVPAGEGHADGIVVQPLVEGRPLEVLRIPFPAPVVAVVTGAAVRPDRAFRTWEGAEAGTAAIGAAARALAASAGATFAPGAPPALHAWLVRHALGEDGPGAALALFPLLGGGASSARDLAAAAALGGVGVVDPRTGGGGLVAGPQPVLAPPWMRELLAARFPLSDLAPIVDRHRSRRAPSAPAHAVDVPGGRLAWSADTDAVDVLRGGVVLATVPAGGVVPLVGFVHAEDAEVDPLWRGLLPGPRTDALRARLQEAARIVLVGLLDDVARHERVASPQRPALMRALASVLDGVSGEDVLRARAAGDPLVARLLALPLFADASGGAGGVDDLLARPNVRWVEPGVAGQPLPERGRVWSLGGAERALVGRLRPLVDATEALRAETRGAQRRAAARAAPPTPPGKVPTATLPAPFCGVVWLGEAGGVQVRVGGAVVERVTTPVPGLAGWIEGPFDTDDAFSTARLPPDARVALRGAAAELLQREAGERPEQLHARLSEALAARGHDHGALLDDPLSPWELVPVLSDTAGEPLDLRALLRLRKGARRLLVGPEGAAGTRRGERVIRGGTEMLAHLRAWFPGTPVEHVSEAEAQHALRKREEEVRKQAGARSKRERALVERACKLWQKWGGGKPPEDAIAASVAAWAAGGRAGWPPLLDADLEGPWAALLAFAAESALAAEDAPEARLGRVAGLAAALAERSP